MDRHYLQGEPGLVGGSESMRAQGLVEKATVI